MNEVIKKERSFGLDLIRTLAIFLVMGSHFMEYSGFYGQIMDGEKVFLLTMLRCFVRICVPLFILLTGYLKCEKKLSKEYYNEIKTILITYFVVSIIMICFKRWYFHDDERLKDMILGIFNYTTIQYGWYVEMYIGLFLFIPFINILYKNIPDKKQKQILILSLILTCSIPQTLQVLFIDDTALDILPNWWGNTTYVLIYYLVGAYIREYKPVIKKKLNLLLIGIILFFEVFVIFYYCRGTTFGKVIPNGLNFNALPIVVISILVFLLLYDLKCDKKSIKKFIKSISINSFTMYLLSAIIDKVVCKNYVFIPTAGQILKNFFTILVFSFVINFILSSILNFMIKILKRFINRKVKVS